MEIQQAHLHLVGDLNGAGTESCLNSVETPVDGGFAREAVYKDHSSSVVGTAGGCVDQPLDWFPAVAPVDPISGYCCANRIVPLEDSSCAVSRNRWSVARS